MPKQILKLEQFSGGINNNSDARDIKLTEFASLTNMNFSNEGKLTVLGEFIRHESTPDNTNTHKSDRGTGHAGYGLIGFDTDYSILHTDGNFLPSGGSAIAETPCNFFALYHDTDSGAAEFVFFQKNGTALDWTLDGQEKALDGTGGKLSFYFIDGALRVSGGGAETSGTNNNKWFGFIPQKQFLKDSQSSRVYANNPDSTEYTTTGTSHVYNNGSAVNKWHFSDAILGADGKGCFPTETNGDGDVVASNAIAIDSGTRCGSVFSDTLTITLDTGSGDKFAHPSIGASYTVFKSDWGVASGDTVRIYQTADPDLTIASVDVSPGNDYELYFPDGTLDAMGATDLTSKDITIVRTDCNDKYELGGFGFANEYTDIGNRHGPASYSATLTYSINDPDSDHDSITDSQSNFIEQGFAVGQHITVTGFSNANNNVVDTELTAVTAGKLTFLDVASSGSATEAVTITSQYAEGEGAMRWGVGLLMSAGENTSGTWMPTTSTRYKFYITTVYDGGTQESLPQLMAMYGAGLMTNYDRTFKNSNAESEIEFPDGSTYGAPGNNVAVHLKPVLKMNGADWGSGTNATDYNFGASTLNATSDGNSRISGVRIYVASNADGYTDLWQVFDCDFKKGTKAFGMDSPGGEGGYAPWQSIGLFPNSDYLANSYGHYAIPDWSSGNRFLHPPSMITYFNNNFHSHLDTIHVNHFKTAVIANRRVYLGNINQTVDGTDIQYSDRILKSPIGRFDKFPSSSFLDAATNDGSQIIHLATFSDRLLQFKERILYIINIAQDPEFIESTHPFKGVTNPGSVCTTDEGVAWANQDGAYFYDGQNVNNLLESQGQDVINVSTWQSFAGVPLVGYIRDKKQIIFIDSSDATGSGDVFIFNLMTRSWMKGATNVVPTGNAIKTNMITDYNNDLIYYDYNDETMYKWSNAPSSSKTIEILTKDFDFGQPSVRKKVYKVYVSYKGDASGVTLNYGFDGDNDTYTGQFYKIGETGASTDATASDTPFYGSTVGTDNWINAEFKPTAAINNIYSFQLKFAGTAATDFEINDISIVYRSKQVK